MLTQSHCRISLATASIALSVLASQPGPAETYVFDQNHTEVRFAYLTGLARQQGRFSHVEGTLQFDEAAPEQSKVTATRVDFQQSICSLYGSRCS